MLRWEKGGSQWCHRSSRSGASSWRPARVAQPLTPPPHILFISLLFVVLVSAPPAMRLAFVTLALVALAALAVSATAVDLETEAPGQTTK